MKRPGEELQLLRLDRFKGEDLQHIQPIGWVQIAEPLVHAVRRRRHLRCETKRATGWRRGRPVLEALELPSFSSGRLAPALKKRLDHLLGWIRAARSIKGAHAESHVGL